MTSTTSPVAARQAARSVVPAWSFLAAGLTAMTLYVVVPALALPLLLAVPAAAVVAIVVGARRNLMPERRRPWYLFAAGTAGFYAGAILRVVVPGADATPAGPAAFVPDLVIVPSYVLVGYALLDMLRRRRGTEDALARADALLMGLGAALAVWSLLLAPSLDGDDLNVLRLVTAAFPMVDAVLLGVIARLLGADGVRQPAMWLLLLSMAVVLGVDLIYAVYEDAGSSTLIGVFDLLSMLGYAAGGAAALHPTMRTLCEPQRVITRSMGVSRTFALGAVTMAPSIMIALMPARNLGDTLVRIGLAGLLAATIIHRLLRSQRSQAHAEEAARHRATHDTLTDLPNRELLAETITQWCERATSEGQEISLIFLDLDRFKVINDTWGHRVGDELLCAVAGRLSAAVRAEDLVCRIGGDEFVIALATPSHDTLAMSLAHRLIGEFAVPFQLSVAADVVVTASIGVARSAGAVQALELIRHADIAMYQAKAAGRGGVACFDTALDDQVTRRARLEQELRGAGERGELSVHYQPILNLATDELDGFEALMRWVHPELGFVSPVDFIPIAEVSGMIVPSGAWLLEEAARQMTVWQAGRPIGLPPLHMSVNVSYRQLRDGSLVVVVRDVLERTGLPASALWLEITESGAMENPESSLDTLMQLHRLGVTLCIDDFGTGYSSMSYLRQFPADIVKIDRSFINGVGQNPDDEAIVRTVTAMTHALGRRVVVEGVETVEQRDWLRELGCDLVQGYLYGAPRAADKTDCWKLRTLTIPSAARVAV